MSSVVSFLNAVIKRGLAWVLLSDACKLARDYPPHKLRGSRSPSQSYPVSLDRVVCSVVEDGDSGQASS
jgi:hypothetical protein